MNSGDVFTASDFVEAFREAWAEFRADRKNGGDEKICGMFSGTTSWTSVLFGANQDPPFRKDWKLFTRTAHHLDQKKPELIKHLRHEDDKIDLLMVGGEQCLKNRGWGYASRHLILVEHENNVDRVDDEFYKVMFRPAELRVVAFPNYSMEYLKSRMGREDPAHRALGRLVELGRKCGPDRLNNLLVLVAQAPRAGGMPEWRYVEMRAQDCSQEFNAKDRLELL